MGWQWFGGDHLNAWHSQGWLEIIWFVKLKWRNSHLALPKWKWDATNSFQSVECVLRILFQLIDQNQSTSAQRWNSKRQTQVSEWQPTTNFEVNSVTWLNGLTMVRWGSFERLTFTRMTWENLFCWTEMTKLTSGAAEVEMRCNKLISICRVRLENFVSAHWAEPIYFCSTVKLQETNSSLWVAANN